MRRTTKRERQSLKNEQVKRKEVVICSKDFWVNIVDFLQQYWALVEQKKDSNEIIVYFINERSGIFASLGFGSVEIAEKALMQNGFKKYNDPLEKYQEYLNPPLKPYFMIRRGESQEVSS